MPDPAALSRIRVVLHRPSHPGNIGSAARALKTMGLARLVIVAPRRALDGEARALAANALDVLEGARFCTTLEEALEGAVLAFAYSARPRELSHEPLDARAAGVQAVQAAARDEVALVFGNESAGLSNHDVLLCNRLAHIPSDPAHGSLNLAAAVQVAAYEVRMAALQAAPPGRGPAPAQRAAGELASLEELEQLYRHFETSLRATGFLDPGKPKRLMERLRRLFGRAALEREELNILRGMLSAWDEPRPGAAAPEARPEPTGRKVD
jgi:tRNA/rRNA methyltransferase